MNTLCQSPVSIHLRTYQKRNDFPNQVHYSGMGWHTSVIPSLGILSKGNFEFKTSLSYKTPSVA